MKYIHNIVKLVLVNFLFCLLLSTSAQRIKLNHLSDAKWFNLRKDVDSKTTIDFFETSHRLAGKTNFYNHSLGTVNYAVQIYFYKNRLSKEPSVIYNVKSNKVLTSFESVESLGWDIKSNLNDKISRIRMLNSRDGISWELYIPNNIVENYPYIEVHSENSIKLFVSVISQYIRLNGYLEKLIDILIEKGEEEQVNTAIDNLFVFASSAQYIRYITHENKNDYIALMKKVVDILTAEIRKVNDGDPNISYDLIHIIMDLIVGNFDIKQSDKLISHLHKRISAVDSEKYSIFLERAVNVFEELNRIHAFKNKAIIRLYLSFLKNDIIPFIKKEKKIQPFVNVLIFDGLKIITRLAAEEDFRNISKLTQDLLDNGLNKYFLCNEITDEKMEEIVTVFEYVVFISSQKNGLFAENIITLLSEVLDEIDFAKTDKPMSNLSIDLNHYIKNNILFSKTYKKELISIFRKLKKLSPNRLNSNYRSIIYILVNP
jgi:hypothetical protein